MTKQYDLLQTITEQRAKEQLKDEKKHYNELKKIYGRGREAVLASLLLFFDEYGKGDKLEQANITKKGLNKLDKDLSKAMSTIYREERKLARTGLKRAIKDEYAYSLFMLSPLLQTKMKNKRMTTKEINEMLEENWAGEIYDETLNRRKKETAKTLRRDLLRLTASGIGIQALYKQFNKRMESDMKHSLLVYQNEQTKKRNRAMKEAFTKEGVEADKVMWVATLDDRTCDKCGPLDGQIFDKGKEPDLPVHPRCRCRVVELVDGWKQTTRRARDFEDYKGYITDAKNYKKWRERQGV